MNEQSTCDREQIQCFTKAIIIDEDVIWHVWHLLQTLRFYDWLLLTSAIIKWLSFVHSFVRWLRMRGLNLWQPHSLLHFILFVFFPRFFAFPFFLVSFSLPLLHLDEMCLITWKALCERLRYEIDIEVMRSYHMKWLQMEQWLSKHSVIHTVSGRQLSLSTPK